MEGLNLGRAQTRNPGEEPLNQTQGILEGAQVSREGQNGAGPEEGRSPIIKEA
jgi:hypothetical protein